MSHLGYYLLALLFCGIFHEAGHAVAAFGERVPIQSAGIFIYYIYPGAFVNVPDQPLQMLSPFRQLKIICAGVWHNIVLYGCTLLLLAGGLKSLFLLFGWQSLEAGLGGVSVVSVRSNSPLAPHLATSSVIYQLNDFSLEQNIADWNAYLLEPSGRQPIVQGFCADSVMDSSDSSLDCCKISDGFPFGQSSNASVSCFQDIHSSTVYKKPEYMGCLPTIQVLASPGVRRCESDTDCQNESGKRCVTPYTPSVKGQLVRVYARLPEWEKTEADQQDKVFVFEGELVDIWESVKVGILVPRFWFLPVSLPHISELLIRYRIRAIDSCVSFLAEIQPV
ncbi:uncharacterized protein BYT42DRAFT_493632 [Radiomyces spectabilis]|uniref:uncharacterized protein n=1 Tax=Radiomyces spectabilis TaxID=64574 RepID=UPI00221E3DDC|nr:uncharacterized protein BYT42DRAFT_493632 [Radiomyces spectabilis]KAI8384788.1 hypothetical protein BYT42DRAFT_493632 [Radiomyces spectabilis]